MKNNNFTFCTSFKSIFIFILLALATACGGGGGGTTPPPVVTPDSITLPASTASPATDATISPSTAIVINFTGTVDIANLTINYSGLLAVAASGGVWSANTNPNDTLTISPTTIWPDGSQVLNISIEDSDGTVLRNISISYVVDSTIPGYTSISPADGSALNPDTTVVITFDESMNPGSLLASGALWDESDKGVWSQTTVLNDTLSLSPAPTWSAGTKALTLDVSDVASNPLVTTLTLSYTVCGSGTTACGTACVDITSDVNNCGACGGVCSAQNSSVMCSSGQCGINSCNAGYADCNSSYDDGCEINTTTDSSNCAACGTSCNDSISCSADSCVDSACSNIPNDAVCPAGGVCTAGICNGLGCSTEPLPVGTTTCGEGVCGSWSGACSYISICDETASARTQTCTAPACDGAGACADNTYLNSQSCVRNTDGITCNSTTCGAWSPSLCNYSDVCAQSAPDRTRTCTPQVCSGGGCVGGTPYVEPSSCTRNTNGISCGTSRQCLAGICEITGL